MIDSCERLRTLLSEIPLYASWAVTYLKDFFDRYERIMDEFLGRPEYRQFLWLQERYPNIRSRIDTMLESANPDEQYRHYSSIVFELKSSMELILGTICVAQAEWVAYVTANFGAGEIRGRSPGFYF